MPINLIDTLDIDKISKEFGVSKTAASIRIKKYTSIKLIYLLINSYSSKNKIKLYQQLI